MSAPNAGPLTLGAPRPLRWLGLAWGNLLVLQSLILALISMWPAPLHLGTKAIGSPQSDTIKHLWTLWWMRAELSHGEPGLRTTLIGHPGGIELFPIEPLQGVFAVVLPLSPTLLSNLLALLDLTLTGVAAGWLATLLCSGGPDEAHGLPFRPRGAVGAPKRRLPALVAGALLQGSAWAAFTLHVGVGELRSVWLLPLCLGLLLRVDQQRSLGAALRAGVVAGLGLAFAAVSCFYYGLFLAVAAVVHSLVGLVGVGGWRPRRALGLMAAAAVAAAIVIPTATAFSASSGERGNKVLPAVDERGAVRVGFDRDSVQLDDLITPRRAERLGSPRARRTPATPADRQRLAYEGGRYLSIFGALLLLAGLAAAPRRAAPLFAVGLVGLLLSLGPVLHIDGEVIRGADGAPLRLPADPLLQWLAGRFANLHFPARFAALGALAVSGLGALSVRRWPALSALAVACVINVAAEDLVPWPRATTALPDFSPLTALATPGPMADLSFAANPNAEHRAQNVAVQLATGRATQGVPLERLDATMGADPGRLRRLPLVKAMRRGEAPSGDLRAEAEAMWSAGFRVALLTGPDAQARSPSRAALQAAWGAPVEAPGAALWSIPEPGSADASPTAGAAPAP